MRLAIITPVLNDWDAFGILLRELDQALAGTDIVARLLVVDDGSTLAPDPATWSPRPAGPITRIDVVTLGCNLGHQRAIAVGLTVAAEADDLDAAVVMDSDGEDRPGDIRRLVEASRAASGTAVLATRTKRHESTRFKLGYIAYKLVFRALIGRPISFGNFSLLPMNAVKRLGYMPELWNNLPAAVLRSRLPMAAIPTERGVRYAGKSRMNLVSLIVHGLSAISVHVDAIFVRVLIGALTFAALSVLAIAVAVGVRLASDLAIPGWTTTVVTSMLLILVQTIVLVVATSLLLLAGRSTRPIIPRSEARHFIDNIWTAWPLPASGLAPNGDAGLAKPPAMHPVHQP